MSRRFITRRLPNRGIWPSWAALLALVACTFPLPGTAQPLPFGSEDDPREQLQTVWWRHENTVEPHAGLSLISDQWRLASGAALNLVTRTATARLQGTLRGGIYGAYRPDLDEAYDLVRLVEFARYRPRPAAPLFARVGLIDRMRLGTGHVVNFYNSAAAWDERTVGAEVAYHTPLLDVLAFTGDVFLKTVSGGRAAVRPLVFSENPSAQTFELGFTYVTDLSPRLAATSGLTAYNLDLRFAALISGALRLNPFASFAWYPEYGSGLGFGVDFESLNFVDLARFRARVALYYNGREFIPGYVGSFYPVSSPGARVLDSERYLTGERAVRFEDVALADALGGNDLETELRLLLFDRFEFWYYFRRHYGSQRLSTYHLRLFLRAPNTLRLNVGLDRNGLGGFFSLFQDLDDQTALVFGLDYRVAGPFWLFLHARYTFEAVEVPEAPGRAFLIQRRFEPSGGMRLTF